MKPKRRVNTFIVVALLLHIPLFAYPVLRLSYWLDLSGWSTSAIFVPVFFSQVFARKTLRDRIGKRVFFLRNTADLLLGLFFIILMVLLMFELLVALFSLPTLLAAKAVLGLSSIIALYGVGLAMKPKVITISLSSKKLTKPLRFVQISDVHIGTRSTRFLATLMTRIEKMDVDFLCITGDLIDQPGVTREQLSSLGEFSKPIYYCTGNHERYEDLEDILSRLRSQGVHVLRNQEMTAGEIQVIGIDDLDDSQQVAKQLQSIEVSNKHFSILLYHRPEGLESCQSKGIDLMLSGHTHGGQIMPFNLLVERVFEHTKGLHVLGESSLYVSEGTGTWGPLIRLGTRSEITLFEVHAV